MNRRYGIWYFVHICGGNVRGVGCGRCPINSHDIACKNAINTKLDPVDVTRRMQSVSESGAGPLSVSTGYEHGSPLMNDDTKSCESEQLNCELLISCHMLVRDRLESVGT